MDQLYVPPLFFSWPFLIVAVGAIVYLWWRKRRGK